jgi:hypothetical protein
MPGRGKGKGKGGKGHRKKKNFNESKDVLTKDRILDEQLKHGMQQMDMWYAQVNKVHGGDKIQVTYYGDKNQTALVDVYVKKNLRRARPKKGDYLLIQARSFNKTQFDAVLFYKEHESKKLLKWKEIPQDESIISFIVDEEDKSDDEQATTKSQKRALRHQRNKQQGDASYLNIDEFFNEGPGGKSIFNKFEEDDTTESQLVVGAAKLIKDNKDNNDKKENNVGNTSKKSNEPFENTSDCEIDVVEEYNENSDDSDDEEDFM